MGDKRDSTLAREKVEIYKQIDKAREQGDHERAQKLHEREREIQKEQQGRHGD